jgi:dihydroorotase
MCATARPWLTVVPHTAAQFGRAIIMPNLRRR